MPELQEALPKYLQVANHYRDQIVSGSLGPGAELPSERQLAVEWNISRPTATRALAALRNQGLVESRQGAGTFVRGSVSFHRRARDRYQRVRDAGRIYGPGERAEIVEVGFAPLPAWVAGEFGKGDGLNGIRRVRVTSSDDEPAELSISWFEANLADAAPQLLEQRRIRSGTVAYVERATERKAVYARDWISARLATATERRLLGLAGKAAAVLAVRHAVYDGQDRPLECVEASYPPDRWTFEQQYSVTP